MSAARMKHFDCGRQGEGMTAAEPTFVLGRYHNTFGRRPSQARPCHVSRTCPCPILE
jgi:hypothetical protein